MGGKVCAERHAFYDLVGHIFQEFLHPFIQFLLLGHKQITT